MAEVDTSIYKTQTQPANPLAQLTQLGQAADTIGQFQAGQAVAQSAGPDGQIDQNKVLSLLTQSPAGSMKAVQTMDALAKLRQAGYAADQSALDTFQKRMAVTHHLFSGLASKTTPGMDDVYETAAAALDPALGASKYGITMPVVMNTIKVLRQAFDQGGPAALRKKALEIQSQAASTSEVLQQHNPSYQVIDQGGQLVVVPTGTQANPAMGTAVPKTLPPQTPVAGPGGTRYLGSQPAVPGGGAVGPDGRPAVAGAPPVAPTPGPAASLPPGYEPAAAAIGGQSGASANTLTQANDTSMGRKAILGNLEDLIDKFEPGKGADWSLIAKNFATRNIPMPDSWKKEGGVLDLKSIASQEEFNKLAVQLAQQQFAAIGGTGTDAKFSSAFETSPNDALTKLGNKQIIRLLKGNEDAIQAKNKAWQEWQAQGAKDPAGHGPQTYSQFAAEFNQHFDPRVFQFKYMSPKERQSYIDAMDPNDVQRLLQDITYARKAGWVNYGAGK